MSIEVRSISKTFGTFRALDRVDLDVAGGELVALLGPSGCGKTTLLRVIAGLETPDAGSGGVLLDGEDVSRTAAASRGVGFVFQHYALFRHMTIFDNVAFGLTVRPRAQRASKAEIRERVMHLLRLVQVDWLADRYPVELSGGQRQRVALARALAVEPRILLLDEPFGSLDARVRRELRRWLRRLHDTLAVTSIFVTHDQEEALEVADRVAVLDAGRVVQVGAPSEVYDHPADAFVYHFLGHANLFPCTVRDGVAGLNGLTMPARGVADGPSVACARPHEVELSRPAEPGSLPAVVRHLQVVGPLVRLELACPAADGPVEVELDRARAAALDLGVDRAVGVRLSAVRVFPAGRREALAEDPRRV